MTSDNICQLKHFLAQKFSRHKKRNHHIHIGFNIQSQIYEKNNQGGHKHLTILAFAHKYKYKLSFLRHSDI